MDMDTVVVVVDSIELKETKLQQPKEITSISD